MMDDDRGVDVDDDVDDGCEDDDSIDDSENSYYVNS